MQKKKNSFIPKPYNDFMTDGIKNRFEALRKSLESSEGKYPTQNQLSAIFDEKYGSDTLPNGKKFITIPQGRISELEKGNVIPNTNDLYAYSMHFHVSTDYLLGFSEVRAANMDIKRASFILGLSEKSLIVLDYLRKFEAEDLKQTATALINRSTISCLNRILEAYYPRVMQSMEDYSDDHKRITRDCSVETIFSKIYRYFNAEDIDYYYPKEEISSMDRYSLKEEIRKKVPNKVEVRMSNKQKIDSKKIEYSINNTLYPLNIDDLYRSVARDEILKELDRIKDMKEGDALGSE